MPVPKKRLEERLVKKDVAEEPLKPYVHHGMDFNIKPREKEAKADCPFCNKENKFSVNINTGQWKCWSCGGGLDKGGGGVLDFIQVLWEVSDKATTSYTSLQKHRGLEFAETLMYWGAVKSVIDNTWMIPAYVKNPKEPSKLRMNNLYRYIKIHKNGEEKWLLLPTPTLKHGVFGLQNFNLNNDEIYICEGPWDGMRLWEVFKTVALKDEGKDEYEETTNTERSLLSLANVVAMPGTNAFVPSFKEYCEDKSVTLCYDNDYPTVNDKTGVAMAPAGYMGAKRATSHLVEATEEVAYLHWGEQGYDPDLPDGYDLRDYLKTDKAASLSDMMKRIKIVPDEWLDESAIKEQNSVQCLPCDNWATLIRSWRKALKWTEGLEYALSCMLASVASTNSIGDQLWMKIIGPPSCGKSTLCEAISVAKKYVLAKSKFTGLHSGFKEGGNSKKDNSLIPLLMGKTFIIKDGDTLLQAPNLNELLADLRDVYDSVSRSHYKNQMGRDYEGVRMTMLLGGTSSLRTIDSSELGQRFLDCVIMEQIDDELEDDILWRQANKAASHVDIEVDPDNIAGHYSPELLEAMQLTGGYVNWLRENAHKVLPSITFSEEAKRQCMYLGKFTSFMRSRPSKHQNEDCTRELAARLVSQHVRAAKCLALVLNRDSVDDTVMKSVTKLGLDTSRGIVLKIARLLHEAATDGDKDKKGLSTKALHIHLNCTDMELKNLLRFLRGIGMLKLVKSKGQQIWLLTEVVHKLCEKVGAV